MVKKTRNRSSFGFIPGVVHLGSPLPSRHLIRCGSASSALAAAALGSTMLVLDVVQLETLHLSFLNSWQMERKWWDFKHQKRGK